MLPKLKPGIFSCGPFWAAGLKMAGRTRRAFVRIAAVGLLILAANGNGPIGSEEMDRQSSRMSGNVAEVLEVSGEMGKQEIVRAARIPIVVGVTGHRDLRAEDEVSLRQVVRKLLEEIVTEYSDSPLLIVSPLAEGADRLVAEEALAIGAELVVPLPMPEGDYLADFETPESKRHFQQLKQQASRVLVVPDPRRDPNPGAFSGEARDRRYALAGAWVSQHCQILLALWDGVQTDLEGGTAAVVDFELNGIPEEYGVPRHALAPSQSGAVYHIVTPRVRNAAPEGNSFEVHRQFSIGVGTAESSSDAYSALLGRINWLNSDLQRRCQSEPETVSQCASWALPESVQEQLPDSNKLFLALYGAADAVAIKFQRETRHVVLRVLWLGALAFGAFEVYDELLPSSPLALLAYPLLLCCGYALVVRSQRRDSRNRYLDYRAFAEGLRIQLFWSLAGVQADVASHYLRKHTGELEWIREALQVAALKLLPGEMSGDSWQLSASDRLQVVYDCWVLDQQRFFERSMVRDIARLRRFKKRATSFLALGGVLTLLTMIGQSLFFPYLHTTIYHSFIIFGVSLSLAVGALLIGYADKEALGEQIRQYEWMSQLFGRAAAEMSELMELGDMVGARSVLFELGKEALAENGDWLLMHRARPLDMPLMG